MEKITAKDNDKIKRYVKLLLNKKARDELGLFVIEGVKLLKEAIGSGVFVEQIFMTEKFLSRFEELENLVSDAQIFLISEAVEKKIAASLSPQGIYAICKKLDKRPNLDKIDNNGSFVALWDLQDPGNVGTIFRMADAMGISGIILSENCCDVYNLKTLRSAMGSLFRMPFLVTDLKEFLSENKGKIISYATVVDKDATPVTEVVPDNLSIAVIGNEGNGLSKEQVNCCDKKITIPMRGSTESLNAAMAATVIIWEFMKKS